MSCDGPLDITSSPAATLRPLGPGAARITGGFWAERRQLNRDVLLPDGLRRLEAVPFALWGNRGEGGMRVRIPAVR